MVYAERKNYSAPFHLKFLMQAGVRRKLVRKTRYQVHTDDGDMLSLLIRRGEGCESEAPSQELPYHFPMRVWTEKRIPERASLQVTSPEVSPWIEVKENDIHTYLEGSSNGEADKVP